MGVSLRRRVVPGHFAGTLPNPPVSCQAHAKRTFHGHGAVHPQADHKANCHTCRQSDGGNCRLRSGHQERRLGKRRGGNAAASTINRSRLPTRPQHYQVRRRNVGHPSSSEGVSYQQGLEQNHKINVTRHTAGADGHHPSSSEGGTTNKLRHAAPSNRQSTNSK